MATVNVLIYAPKNIGQRFRMTGMVRLYYIASKVSSQFDVRVGQTVEIWDVDNVDYPQNITPAAQAQIIDIDEDQYGGIELDLVIMHPLDEEPYAATRETIFRNISRGYLAFDTPAAEVALLPTSLKAKSEQLSAAIAYIQRNPLLHDFLQRDHERSFDLELMEDNEISIRAIMRAHTGCFDDNKHVIPPDMELQEAL